MHCASARSLRGRLRLPQQLQHLQRQRQQQQQGLDGCAKLEAGGVGTVGTVVSVGRADLRVEEVRWREVRRLARLRLGYSLFPARVSSAGSVVDARGERRV